MAGSLLTEIGYVRNDGITLVYPTVVDGDWRVMVRSTARLDDVVVAGLTPDNGDEALDLARDVATAVFGGTTEYEPE